MEINKVKPQPKNVNAVALGSIRTPAKTVASRANAVKGAAARRRPLESYPCACGAACRGVTTCPRGRIARLRQLRAAS